MESDNNRASNDGAEELGGVCFLVVGHLYYELENGVVNFLIVSGRVPTTNEYGISQCSGAIAI